MITAHDSHPLLVPSLSFSPLSRRGMAATRKIAQIRAPPTVRAVNTDASNSFITRNNGRARKARGQRENVPASPPA